jgi:hypothetical protein
MNAMLSLRRTRKTSNGLPGRSRTTVDAGRAAAMLIDSVYLERRNAVEQRSPGRV